MTNFIEFAILGIAASSAYALLSSSLVLIYRGSGILNIAHGAYAMAGGFLYYQFSTLNGISVVWSAVLAVLGACVLGALTHLLVMVPLRNSVPLVRVIATLGVLAVLQGLAQVRYGGTGNALVADPFLPQGKVTFHDLIVPYDRIILFGFAVVVVLGLHFFSRHTTIGLAMTAAAENEIGAASVGWSPNLLALFTWTVGAGLAGFAGVMIVPLIGLQVPTLTLIVIAAMAAALFASFESFPKTLVASMAIGILQSWILLYGTNAHWAGVGDAVPFLGILAVMLVRGSALPLRGHIVEQLPKVGSGRVRLGYLIPIVVVLGLLMIWVFSLDLTTAIAVQSIAGIVLLSVVVLTGYAGQLSLAQMGLAGIGAYFAGRLVSVTGAPFLLALIVGVLGAVVVGLLFALPALRTRGVNLAVVTLGLGVAVQSVLFENGLYTGGSKGTNVGAAHLFGINLDPVAHPQRYAVFCLVSFALAGVLVAALRRSTIGRQLISIRTNERAAASIGISVFRTKLLAFGISSGIAGLGGILLAFNGHYITYSTGFDALTSINQVGNAVVGGLGYASGPLVGSTLQAGGIGSYVLNHFGSLDPWLTVIGGVSLILMLLGNANGAVANLTDMTASLVARFRGREPAEVRAGEKTSAPSRTIPEPSVDKPSLALVARDVTVRYGGVTAVDSVGLEVRSGEVVGLIGPNGAGKTTMIDALTGFVAADMAELRLGDTDLRRTPAHRRARLGLTRSFQSLELLEDLTVADNLMAAAERHQGLRGVLESVLGRRRSLPVRVQEIVDQMGLGDCLHLVPGELPYGRRRLVAIARAAAASPTILLLDEPAAGLDDTETRELATVIRSLAEEQGLGVLLVEHDMSLVMDVCDQLVVLNFGQKIAEGSPAEVQQLRVVREAYLGDMEDEEEADCDDRTVASAGS
ncbi:ABC transporter permease subunit [Nocardioides terrisoli]|uniref:ABC transporter permease subunit n=1 Tax=Nocardioides terrisoli TaxID=3388267 RepID=UPI00287B8CA7|nr:ATP-binding cassette domain-containing protein [Nocardioides marmorisolisilvae]